MRFAGYYYKVEQNSLRVRSYEHQDLDWSSWARNIALLIFQMLHNIVIGGLVELGKSYKLDWTNHCIRVDLSDCPPPHALCPLTPLYV